MLKGNSLTGTIPTELGRLRRLGKLHARSVEVMDLGYLTRFQGRDFDLSSNFLVGTIPSELGWQTVLSKCVFVNQIELLPLVISYCSAAGDTFSVANNNLVGSIPVELGNLTEIGKGLASLFYSWR